MKSRPAKETSSTKTSYTLTLSEEQVEALGRWCDARCWSFYSVPYARFAFRGDQVNVVAYGSGKVVIQGKKTETFVTYVLEAEITKTPQLGYEEIQHPEWFQPHAGMDESGKGDFFGPLVVACVVADGVMVRHWLSHHLKESKKVASDGAVLKLDKLVRGTKGVVVQTAFAGMSKYNELYRKFGNLNELLSWFHAKALEGALKRKAVSWGLLDQFARRASVSKYFKAEGFVLRQRQKAEDDPIVAAASIVARAEYLRALRDLRQKSGIELPKGAGSKVKEQGRKLLSSVGMDRLGEFAKLHFKTAHELGFSLDPKTGTLENLTG
ncbi:MAG: ribonuclease HIII [Puniceicoccales bacterium]|jgi:ribonuclease HIII|nr:ribonuclease HIII [Puniceicoccales bacterium]